MQDTRRLMVAWMQGGLAALDTWLMASWGGQELQERQAGLLAWLRFHRFS